MAPRKDHHLAAQRDIMTLRKHTRHFSKAKWRVFCTHFELSACMFSLYTADCSLQRLSKATWCVGVGLKGEHGWDQEKKNRVGFRLKRRNGWD